MALSRIGLAVVVLAACGSPRAPAQVPADPDRIAIIAAERGPQGARLVALDERGERQFELLEPPSATARDTHPALSPDGAWIVFVSSRDRSLDVTSLWIAPVAPSAVPRRLTTGAAIDSHPTWTRDGTAIIFASTREGGDFDLYSLAIDRGAAVGEPQPLTAADSHEVMPSAGRDGSVIFTQVSTLTGDQVESHLVARAADGTLTHLTEGPADTAPALSPDERTLVFARPVQHAAGPDADLWTMPRNGTATSAAPLIDLPLTDETSPVWSPDGRYVFATSVLRGAQGNPIFSSVIVIDMQERPRTARLLADRLAVIARLTPAITQTPLDAEALAADPEYLPELARIMGAALANQREPSSP